MKPDIYCINDNLFRITYGKRKNKSIVVLDVAQTPLENPSAPVGICENGIVLCKDGEKLISLGNPVFEDYEVRRNTGGETSIRKTVDGIKATVSGGGSEVIRTSRHATFDVSFGDDILFGLGSHEEGYPCLNGHFFPMIQENMRIAVPFMISNKGYAILVDNTSYMSFDFSKEHSCRLYIDCADNVDIYLFTGETEDIYSNYRYLTGETPMLPKWACGYIQSKERYTCAQELVDVVQEYRKRNVPLDGIVQDWQYWGENLWGEKVLDLSRYADFDKYIDRIHEMGAHLMVSIWPNMSGDGANQTEFRDAGLLLGDGSVYNAFDKAGRDMYWEQAYEGLFKYGLDAWWCDSSEPYDANWGGETRRPQDESVERSVNEFKKFIDDADINAYSLFHSMGIYENQRRVSDKRVLNLTRSGFAGQHRYATVTWSGDIAASWEVYRRQIHILQNYVSTGEAYWNCDIGAFFVKNQAPWFWSGEYDRGCEDEAYRELYVRWLQFAAFTPMMRSHGTDTPREIWRFGEPGTVYYDAIKSAIELRYKLLPFFYSCNAAVTRNGEMPVLPLALAFPKDKAAASCFDEYMYGREILVCPVLYPGEKIRKVYLPKGTWFDFYTGRKYDGGKEYDIAVSPDSIPLFAKAGSLIPTALPMQHTGEYEKYEITLMVFGDADGEFLLYEDLGDGYDYENGAYSLVKINYCDSTREIELTELGNAEFAHDIITKRMTP